MFLKNFSIYLPTADRYLVRDLTFSLQPQDKCALIGEEGNGKSTLLALMQGQDLSSYVQVTGELDREGAFIARLPQSLSAEDLKKDPGTFLWEQFPDFDLDYGLFYRLLDELKLDDGLLHSSVSLGQLSGGERIKILLLLVQLKKPDIYLLDEPSNNLDFEGLEALEQFISKSDKALIFVSHDELLLENCANAILHIEHLGPELTPRQTFVRTSYSDYRSRHLQRYQREMSLAKKERSQFDAKMRRHQQIFERVQHELREVSRKDPESAKNLKDKMRSVKAQEHRYNKEAENLRAKPLKERPIRLDFEEDLALPHSSKEILNLSLDELRVGDHLSLHPGQYQDVSTTSERSKNTAPLDLKHRDRTGVVARETRGVSAHKLRSAVGSEDKLCSEAAEKDEHYCAVGSQANEAANAAKKVRLLSRHIDLKIRGVERICIVGRNGCGKSTLLNIIRQKMQKNNISLAYMPQDYFDAMDPGQTAIDFLSRSAYKSEHTAVRTFLGSLEFRPEEMFLPLGQLSGGQRAKLYLAKMVFSEAGYLLLDEPTRNLSPLSAPKFRAALSKYMGGIIAVSHDRKFIRELFDKVYRLDEEGLHLLDPDEIAAI